MELFLKKLMEEARSAGLEACEAYVVERDSFRVMTTEGEIVEYKSNAARGLGFRGLLNGRMGYASTEAFDEEAIAQLVKGVKESAELCEDDDSVFLYDGQDAVPEMNLRNEALSAIPAEEKIARVLEMEKHVKAYDSRVDKTSHNTIQTGSHTIRIVNSYGMDRSFTEDMCLMYGQATAREGDHIATGFYGVAGHDFAQLDAKAIGDEIARRAVCQLGASAVPTGHYRVVFLNEAMADLLSTFSGIFSAQNAQKGMSLLKGRIGETVAAPCVTIVDDPLLKDGLESRPFDAEGVPSKTHTVIENGVFRTFLHNLKTAHKDGVKTTGNASKAGYASSVQVAPSNFYLKAGNRSLEEMLSDIGEGIVITEVSGLHAGANPVSGDFSLLSKGYLFKDGQPGQAVEQITVAGNFYELMKNAREMANDLLFPLGAFGCPSVDAGELSISGK